MENKFIPCRRCAHLPGPKPGFIYVANDLTKEHECHQKYREKKLYSIRAKTSDLWENPPDIRETYKGERSLGSKDAFITYIDGFKSYRDKSVYMHGPNGTQKTSIAMWGGLELIKQGWKVQYILMYRLIALLTSSFDKREEYEVILNKLKSADLLIIDEAFTKDKVLLYKSGYQLPFLDSFLRERIDVYRRGTLFISNKDSSEISGEGFGKSLQDLIIRNTFQTDLEFLDNHRANDINNFTSGSIFN